MVRAAVFDAFGTLFDIHSLTAACEAAFPGRGEAINRLWRQKQLEYSWLRTALGRYRDFWGITGDALAYACGSLECVLTDDIRARILAAYDSIAAVPEASAALTSLRARGTGIHMVVWVNRSGAPPDALDLTPDHTLLDLTGVASL